MPSQAKPSQARDVSTHKAQLTQRALQVQARIGASKAIAFDLTAACSGFVVGLVTAAQFIRAGRYRHVLVIGADALSRYVDWRDRGESSPKWLPAGSALFATWFHLFGAEGLASRWNAVSQKALSHVSYLESHASTTGKLRSSSWRCLQGRAYCLGMVAGLCS